MQKRRFGRTNLDVSVVGFGGTWISQISMDEAKKVVHRAFELGINYFDTAKMDGDSETKIGAGLEGVRDDCVIATKIWRRTKKDSLDDIRDSLKQLRTDRLDLIQLHGIDDLETLEKATSSDGALETCKQARSEGLVDFIGISSHKPQVLIKAIQTNEFDTIIVPVNVIVRQALDELLPFAKEMNIGVVAMKPLSVKTSKITTCLYNPSLSLLSKEDELNAFLGQDIFSRVRSALRFVLAQDVSVVIPGLRSIEEVETAAKAGEEYAGLTADEKEHFRIQTELDYCQDCGLCMPCPKNIDIAATLRFDMLSSVYGLKNWARELYEGLEVGVENCTECGECEPKCPYQLPIMNMLKQTEINRQQVLST